MSLSVWMSSVWEKESLVMTIVLVSGVGQPIFTKATPALSMMVSKDFLSLSATWMTTPGFSANNSLTISSSWKFFRSICIPPDTLAKVISKRVVIRPPADMSWPARIIPPSTISCMALNASAKYSGFMTVGTSLPILPCD